MDEMSSTDAVPDPDLEAEEQPTARRVVVVPNSIDLVSVLGPGDEHLGLLERAFGVYLHVRGSRITIQGQQPPFGTQCRQQGC